MDNPVESERFNTDYLQHSRNGRNQALGATIEDRAIELAKQMMNVRITEEVQRERERARIRLAKHFDKGVAAGKREAKLDAHIREAKLKETISKLYFNAGRYAQGARDAKAVQANAKMLKMENENE